MKRISSSVCNSFISFGSVFSLSFRPMPADNRHIHNWGSFNCHSDVFNCLLKDCAIINESLCVSFIRNNNVNNVKPLEQFSFPIPQILSTMTPKEDSDILIIEPNIKKFHTNINLKHSEKLLIEECNKKIENHTQN